MKIKVNGDEKDLEINREHALLSDFSKNGI